MPKRLESGRRGKPHDAGSVDQRLARLLDTPHLARLVPQLAPETLHQLIRYRGLDACRELVASATPEQLRSVLDLDLWRGPQPGSDEVFDEARLGEWLELLVDNGASAAARVVAAIDQDLVVAGLARHVRVFDHATFAPSASTDDDRGDAAAGSAGDLESEVGGYLVRARRADAWDAIVTLLLALDSDHHDYFHAVMRGCRRQSNSSPEIDGLDDLLLEPAQHLFDVTLAREGRRTRQGYTTPAESRAFLQMARQPRHRLEASSSASPLAAAYFRAMDNAAPPAGRAAQPVEPAVDPAARADISESIGEVVDLLVEAGVVPGRSRAQLEGTVPDPVYPLPLRVRSLMEYVRDASDTAFLARHRELAFLANTLIAGCSIHSRPFTPQEASDAALGVCNLGIESGPGREPGTALSEAFLVDHDLVTAFEAGWAVLHEDVGLFVADHLIAALAKLRSADPDTQRGLYTLRRELVRQRDAGAPWRARGTLDVIAVLDPPIWASLVGLLDECPVLPAAMRATLEGRTSAVSATAFEFIATTGQIVEIRRFAAKLLDLLLR